MSSQSPFSTHADPVEYLRVRWKGLKPGRESTIVAHRFNPEKHEKLAGKPTVDVNGRPLPPKFQTTIDEAAGRRTIDVILAEVGDDPEKAAAELEAEQAKGDTARSTLVEKLQAVIDGNHTEEI